MLGLGGGVVSFPGFGDGVATALPPPPPRTSTGFGFPWACDGGCLGGSPDGCAYDSTTSGSVAEVEVAGDDGGKGGCEVEVSGDDEGEEDGEVDGSGGGADCEVEVEPEASELLALGAAPSCSAPAVDVVPTPGWVVVLAEATLPCGMDATAPTSPSASATRASFLSVSTFLTGARRVR